MIPILVFDIETIPDLAGLRKLNAEYAALSDAEAASTAFAARRAKTGSDFLPHHLHQIAAIACAFRDDQGFRVKSLGDLTGTEAQLIQDFFRIVERHTPQIVSWNGGGFDLPVLHYRGLMHHITAPRYWEMGETDRDFKWNNYLSRYHTRHIDLMDLLALYTGRANAPLDELSKLCGFPGKIGVDGAQVWPMIQHGQLQQVRNYCETDVVNTYLLYCRFQYMRGCLSWAEYTEEIELVKASLKMLKASHWQEYLDAWA